MHTRHEHEKTYASKVCVLPEREGDKLSPYKLDGRTCMMLQWQIPVDKKRRRPAHLFKPSVSTLFLNLVTHKKVQATAFKQTPSFAIHCGITKRFVKAADQSCHLDLGCSSPRQAPKSYNNRSSLPQQSALYVSEISTTTEKQIFAFIVVCRSPTRVGGWMDGWTDGWMDGWMDRWMDGWMD